MVVAGLPSDVQFCPCGQGFPPKVSTAPPAQGDSPHRAVHVPVDRNRAWHPQCPGEGAHHPPRGRFVRQVPDPPQSVQLGFVLQGVHVVGHLFLGVGGMHGREHGAQPLRRDHCLQPHLLDVFLPAHFPEEGVAPSSGRKVPVPRMRKEQCP